MINLVLGRRLGLGVPFALSRQPEPARNEVEDARVLETGCRDLTGGPSAAHPIRLPFCSTLREIFKDAALPARTLKQGVGSSFQKTCVNTGRFCSNCQR